MNATECIAMLRQFNEWRRWDDDDAPSPAMPHPKAIGLAIDAAIRLIEGHEALLAAINRTYSVLLSDSDTKSALTKAEDMLREAIAITKGGA